MLQLPSNQLITVPFCALGTPTTDFVLPPITGSDSSTTQTQQFGIPPIQQEDPNLGGLPVLRTETNGVLQFYSNVLYFINQGGQFTFDSPQSIALGGYSQGAVLFNFPTSSYVISLIDNNTFDFVTTPSYIDGVHWEQLNSLAYPDITDVAGAVVITGAGGLSVTHALNVNGACTFLNDLLGPFIGMVRTNTTLPDSYQLELNAESTSLIGGAPTAAIGLAGSPGNAAILFPYASGNHRPYLANTSPGDNTDATAIAIVGELPITQQFIGSGTTGGTFTLQATTTNGHFPATTGCSISGYINTGSTITPGTMKNYEIDLVSNGILATTPTTNGKGSSCMPDISGGLNYGIGGGCLYINTLNTLLVSGTNPSYSTSAIGDGITFNIIVK